MLDLVMFLVPIAGAYFIGTMVEANHYQEINKREKDSLHLPAITSKKITDPAEIENAELVMGSVVISLDYFKRFLAGLRNIFGGRIASYETLLDRGRREAILRMKEKAKTLNADLVINMRFVTATIGQVTAKKGGNIGCFEVMAYGTAVKLKQS